MVARQPDTEQIETWRRGVVLSDGYKTQPCNVRLRTDAGKGAWLTVIMKEGRKRQIREIASLLGLPVVRILRVRIGTLRLGTLKPGEWRELTQEEITGLQKDEPREQSFKRPIRKPRPVRAAKPEEPKPTKKELAKKFIRNLK